MAYTCYVCHSEAKHKCDKCKTIRYCGESCQRHHWRVGGHGKNCKVIQKEYKYTRRIRHNYILNANNAAFAVQKREILATIQNITKTNGDVVFDILKFM